MSSALIQHLASLPSPTISPLVAEVGPVISWLRWAALVLSWKSRTVESWLALILLWTMCLGANAVLIYFLPLAVVIPALLPYLPLRRAPSRQLLPIDHATNMFLRDVRTLHLLLPTPHIPQSPSFTTTLRIAALLTPPYTLITHTVPMPVLIGLVGTFFFTYRAPWACYMRRVLRRNACVENVLSPISILLLGLNLDPSSDIPASSSSDFGNQTVFDVLVENDGLDRREHDWVDLAEAAIVQRSKVEHVVRNGVEEEYPVGVEHIGQFREELADPGKMAAIDQGKVVEREDFSNLPIPSNPPIQPLPVDWNVGNEHLPQRSDQREDDVEGSSRLTHRFKAALLALLHRKQASSPLLSQTSIRRDWSNPRRSPNRGRRTFLRIECRKLLNRFRAAGSVGVRTTPTQSVRGRLGRR